MHDEMQMGRLEPLLRRLSAVEGPAEVFKILLEAGRLAAPRAAVLLVRQGQLHGWGSVGYETDVAQAIRRFREAPEGGWLGRLVGTADTLVPRQAGESDPDFGQEAAAEATGCVVRVKGKPIAVVVLERPRPEAPWSPEILAMAVTVAQLRLELDVWQRRVQAMQAKSAPAVATAPTTTPAPVRAATPPAVPTETKVEVPVAAPVEAPAAEATAVEPVETSGGSDESSDPDLDAARRYARLVATDIRLYNEESVVLGRKNGDLSTRIADHIGRGKETFLRRHGKLGPAGLELLHEAFVQVLAGGDDGLIPRSSLD